MLFATDKYYFLAWLTNSNYNQIAVSDKHIFTTVIKDLKIITHLITWCAIFEDLYMQRDLAARDELKAALIRLYAEVLMYLAKVKQYF